MRFVGVAVLERGERTRAACVRDEYGEPLVTHWRNQTWCARDRMVGSWRQVRADQLFRGPANPLDGYRLFARSVSDAGGDRLHCAFICTVWRSMKRCCTSTRRSTDWRYASSIKALPPKLD